MNKKLFVGTTNGLELWVDELALEQLRLEQENRRKKLLSVDGRKTIPGYHPYPIEVQIQKFVNKFAVNGDCLEWCGPKDLRGYGRFYLNRKTWNVSRLMFFITKNPIQMPKEVNHHCDNPPCANPAHLFAGNAKLNAEDRDRKGHGSIGEMHPQAKLTVQMVREIRAKRASGASGISLAREYGVTNTHITYIVKRKLWQCV